ncbi:MAG: SAM-dependent methyltransferase [Burkholderiaceae bacterium]|jgi:SAM-dependent methyltransferase|nr:MAG: SAM-dependent methyltransferase [Burkholderiaceae bacterium]
MTSVHRAAELGFGREAGTYEQGRPDYPAALTGWLAGPLALGPGRTVADVGAGTGKFTRLLEKAGTQVIAIEPVAAMRAQLQALLPEVRALAGSAEAIPLRSESLDTLTCAQAFHWFASKEALDEFRRVLKPGGRLGLVWNVRDESVDWVAQITRIITPYEGDAPRFHSGTWRRPFPHPGFGELVEQRFTHTHVGPPQRVIVERFLSVSFIAALPPADKAAVRGQLEELIATHPALRGQGEVVFPYRTQAFHCLRL